MRAEHAIYKRAVASVAAIAIVAVSLTVMRYHRETPLPLERSSSSLPVVEDGSLSGDPEVVVDEGERPRARQLASGDGRAAHDALPEETEKFGPLLVVRLVDAIGDPVADTPTRVWVPQRGGFDALEERNTDSEGVLRVHLDDWYLLNPVGTVVIEKTSRHDEVIARATIDVQRALPLGAHHAGTAVLRIAPAIVTGRVANSSGAAVAQAAVRVHGPFSPAECGGAKDCKDDEHWTQESLTEQDGTFRVTGWLSESASLDLLVRKSGYLPTMKRVVSFAKDVTVVLSPAGECVGKLVVKDQCYERLLIVAASEGSVQGDPAWPQGSHTRPNAEGFFEISLPTGVANLAIGFEDEPTPFFLDYPVIVGEKADGQASEIDLRYRIHSVSLRIVDAQFQPIREGRIRKVILGSYGSWQSIRDGEVTLCTGRNSLDVEVLAAGHRMRRVDDVQDQMIITLEPGIPVRLRLPNDVGLPTPSLRLMLILVGEASGYEAPEHGLRAPLDERGECSLLLPRAGPYDYFWRLQKLAGTKVVTEYGPSGACGTVIVAERLDEQIIDVSIESKDIARARESL